MIIEYLEDVTKRIDDTGTEVSDAVPSDPCTTYCGTLSHRVSFHPFYFPQQ